MPPLMQITMIVLGILSIVFANMTGDRKYTVYSLLCIAGYALVNEYYFDFPGYLPFIVFVIIFFKRE